MHEPHARAIQNTGTFEPTSDLGKGIGLVRRVASYIRHGRAWLAGFPRMAFSGLAFGVLLLLFLWTGFTLVVSQERNLIVQAQFSQNLNLARAFEENVVRTVAAADLVLRDLDAGYKRLGRKFDVAGFARERRDLRGPFTLFGIIDEHADVTVQDPMPAKRLNLRNNDNFRFHTAQDSDALFISTPRKGTTTGRWEFFVSRRMNKADGSFGGFVSVGIDVEYLAAFYDHIDLGKDALIVLVGRDGIVRARGSGAGASAGQDLSGVAGFREEILTKDRGSVVAVSPIDGVTRLIGFQALKDYPLVVAVATSEAATLAAFRGRRNSYAGILIVVSLVILGFSLVAASQVRAQARIAESLRQSEQRFALAVRGSSDGIWDWNILTGEDYLAPRWKEILGYRDDEIENVDASFFALVHPEDRARVDEAVQRHLEAGESYHIEFRMLRKDGNTRWILSRGEAVRDTAGRAVRMVGSITDVTERKDAEDRLRASEARLREAQALAGMGNWELDLVSGKLYWSDEIYRLFEIDPARFGASYEAFLNAIHPDDRERVNHAYTVSVANRNRYAIVHRLRMADGRIKHVQERCQTMYADDGRPLRSVGTVQDITDRKRAEEERQRLEREILEIGESQQRRIGRELHDGLGQQLTSVALMAKVLEHKLRDSGGEVDEAKRIVEAVNQATSSMRSLARGLNPVDLGENGLMAALDQMAATVSSQVAVKCEFRCDDPVLIQDNAVAVHLYRIAQEAVNNALKHSGAKRIDIELKGDAGGLRLSVSDNGVGLAANGPGRGHGMGLEIMRYRVDAIGGKIKIRARAPSGTVVSVTLASALHERSSSVGEQE